jgi:hypothetical protein
MTMSEAELIERLERLERAHRRLKRFSLAALVIATALATIYATQPVSQKITAHQFDVVDDSGKVRATMGMGEGAPGVKLSDAQGKVRAEWVLDTGGAGFVLYDAEGNPHEALNVTPEGEPTMWLSNAEGFELHLGGLALAMPSTGATQHTSAASIVMLGKDKKLIWRAP